MRALSYDVGSCSGFTWGSAMPGEATPYDRVHYPGFPFRDAHPDHLSVLATLLGMEPAPIRRCRVLELGCGEGGHLLPIAYQWPDSDLIGIDLSREAIERGTRVAADMELTNVQLLHCDLMELGRDLGDFDYIIAHGVFSWVPEAVRAKVLEIVGHHLTPNGIAYISYNAYPGSHLRNIAREIMIYGSADARTADEKVRHARVLLSSLADAASTEALYGAALRVENERVSKLSDAVLFHDDLDRASTPFWLHEVVAMAGQFGLQYLCEANLSHSTLAHHESRVKAALAPFSDQDLFRRDQFLDFLEGQGFHKTLLCRATVPLRQTVDPQCLTKFSLAGFIAPATNDVDLGADSETQFKTRAGATLSTNHPLAKAALLCLARCWPEAIGFARLADQATELLERAGRAPAAAAPQDPTDLALMFSQAFWAGHIDLYLCPPPLTSRVSERPEVSRLARKQAETAAVVTNLQHGVVALEDPIVLAFLPLVDGTRDIQQLTGELIAVLASRNGVDQQSGGEISPATVAGNLQRLASLALLIR